MSDVETVERNRASQRVLYGESLAELFQRIGAALGLNQGRMAEVLGLSAPMLSQLMHAQRVKIGNPAVAGRLQELLALAEDPDRPMTPETLQPCLDAVRASQPSVTMSRIMPRAALDDSGDGVRTVQALFRAVAAAGDYDRAADRVEAELPDVARLLRVYGAGRTADARAHFEDHRPLM